MLWSDNIDIPRYKCSGPAPFRLPNTNLPEVRVVPSFRVLEIECGQCGALVVEIVITEHEALASGLVLTGKQIIKHLEILRILYVCM